MCCPDLPSLVCMCSVHVPSQPLNLLRARLVWIMQREDPCDCTSCCGQDILNFS